MSVIVRRPLRSLQRGMARMRQYWEDRAGATLVQFVAVLPVFVLVVIGTFATFKVMSSRDTLCDAVNEAARYLQIEGPHFDSDDPRFDYPGGWEIIATDIINEELASRTITNLYPVDRGSVKLWPESPRRSPNDTLEQARDPRLEDNLFYLTASKVISAPLGAPFSFNGGEPGTMKLVCRRGAFYEGVPLEPTLISRGPEPVEGCPRDPIRLCRACPGCTSTPIPEEGTPTVCPDCRKR